MVPLEPAVHHGWCGVIDLHSATAGSEAAGDSQIFETGSGAFAAVTDDHPDGASSVKHGGRPTIGTDGTSNRDGLPEKVDRAGDASRSFRHVDDGVLWGGVDRRLDGGEVIRNVELAVEAVGCPVSVRVDVFDSAAADTRSDLERVIRAAITDVAHPVAVDVGLIAIRVGRAVVIVVAHPVEVGVDTGAIRITHARSTSEIVRDDILNRRMEGELDVVHATRAGMAVAHDRATEGVGAVTVAATIQGWVVTVRVRRVEQMAQFMGEDHDVPVLRTVGLERGREEPVEVARDGVA